MSRRTFILLFTLLLTLLAYWVHSTTTGFTGRAVIDDKADIFSIEDEQELASYHAMLLDYFDIDYHVLTINRNVDIDPFSAEEFKRRNVGQNSGAYRGLLLVINTAADELRMEVSGNLESVFTDAFVSYVERRQMVPFFNENRVSDGVFATGEIIRQRAMEARQGKEFDESVYIGSIGGGAKTDAGIGEGRQALHDAEQADVPAAETPELSLSRLLNAYRQHNNRRDLDVLTPASRAHMADMVVTMAQMDNVYKRYKDCDIDKVVYSHDKTLAVVLFKLADRACDPFLFEKGADNKWRIDLKTAGIGLGHTYGNIWYIHFDRYEESGIWRYMFGFRDFYFHRPEGEQFDHQGIPYYNKWGIKLSYVNEGAVITKVQPDSFVEKIGLQEGDLITGWEGSEAPPPSYLGWRMNNVRAGLDVEIVYLRHGQIKRLIVQAPPKPETDAQRWGMTVSRTGPNYPVVSYVTPGSQGDKMGLTKGDYIVRWQDKENPLIRDIFRSIRAAETGELIFASVLRDDQTVTFRHIAEPRRKMSRVH